ncbi:endolytic transglycosylase MltG [Oceanobacillus iheyensis]|uniref:endolytic transglycosylase MltG n=1 Tax=Oceanobacillus iheyensis TaxID=182710 RepID=UPI0036434183
MSNKEKQGGFFYNMKKRAEEASTVRKIVSIIIIAMVLVLIIGGISGYLYINSSLKPVDPDSDEEIAVEIPMGSSTSMIANTLEENGIIKDARVFRFYTKFNNITEFQAGEYTFTPSMDFNEIIESLQTGRVVMEATHRITIPEGLSVDQIAEIYSENLSFTKEEFLERISDEAYIEELIEKYPDILTEEILQEDLRTPLEGYLFASTYDFYEEDPSIDTIIEKMLQQTQTVYNRYREQVESTEFTIHEAITFASIIEKETATEEQRPQIAGVFYNRIENEMKLQTDPTVIYALGEHQEVVTFEDLEIESPYNTYLVEGLPVGPISNFAENSLKAVVEPEESDYLYFLHDSEGNLHFAEDFEQHVENREEYIN